MRKKQFEMSCEEDGWTNETAVYVARETDVHDFYIRHSFGERVMSLWGTDRQPIGSK